MTRVVAVANDLGLLAEEYDTGAGRQTGNFPQALTHIALINTAHNLVRGEDADREAGDAALEVAAVSPSFRAREARTRECGDSTERSDPMDAAAFSLRACRGTDQRTARSRASRHPSSPRQARAGVNLPSWEERRSDTGSRLPIVPADRSGFAARRL